jgi:mannonate dehydratase
MCRTPRIWRSVLAREDWHTRLLHGSDHPLPGVMPLYAPAQLAALGLLDEDAVAPLRRIRHHNPLLFDFVLKRQLRDGTARLPRSVFETRHFFAHRAA